MLVLGANAGALRDQIEGLGDRSTAAATSTRSSSATAAPRALRACAPVHTLQGMRAMVAWRLDVRMAPVSEGGDPPVVLFQAPSIYRPYEADPAYDGTQARAAASPARRRRGPRTVDRPRGRLELPAR